LLPSLTRDRFVEALRTAASYTPKAKFPVPCMDPTAACFSVWRSGGMAPVPEQAPYLFWGYGWLDSTVSDAVVSCALRRACPAKPAEATAYNEQRQQAKTVTGLYPLAPRPGNDARSGRDAGEDAKTAVRISDRTAYQAELAGTGFDFGDAYLVKGSAGRSLSIDTSADPPASLQACWVVFDPDGRRMTPVGTANLMSCDPGVPQPKDVRLSKSGTYLVLYRSEIPHEYAFTVTVR
jgi:hypothetical protein